MKIHEIIPAEKLQEIAEIAKLVGELAKISERLKELNVKCKIQIK